jgi:type III secretion protein U
LAWFLLQKYSSHGEAALSQGTKTHPPSKRKLEKAREKGDWPNSREFSGSVALAAGCLGLFLFGPGIVKEILGFAKECFSAGGEELSQRGVRLVFRSVAWIGGLTLAGALLSSWPQSGFAFRYRADLGKLNPVKGLGRLFSRDHLADSLFMLLRVAVFLLLGAFVLVVVIPPIVRVPLDRNQLVTAGIWGFGRVCLFLVVPALLFGVADLFFKRRRYFNRLHMSREEVLQERKEQEGDPRLRSERRRRHRQLLAGTQGVRHSSVVVVNPTHIAVALRYRPEEDEAPVVLDSGKEDAASRIRSEAVRFGIPVVENVPLARALLLVEIGDMIPESLYQAAAEVIRSIQGLERGEHRRSSPAHL